jgi:hypothetical protein
MALFEIRPETGERKATAAFWALLAGSVIGLIAIVVAVVLLARWWQQSQQLNVQSEREQGQVEDLVATCSRAANPQACEEQRVNDAALRLGAEACKALEGDAYDGCVWNVAREQRNPEVCQGIKDGVSQTACSDELYRRIALSNTDSKSCDKISDEQDKSACNETVLASIAVQGTCAEHGVDESVCDQQDLFSQIVASRNPARCAELADEARRLDCTDTIGPGDVDLDGLNATEEAILGTSDLSADTDDDGLNDYDEVKTYGTDPLNPDTDGDGYTDGQEVNGGYDPLAPPGAE